MAEVVGQVAGGASLEGRQAGDRVERVLGESRLERRERVSRQALDTLRGMPSSVAPLLRRTSQGSAARYENLPSLSDRMALSSSSGNGRSRNRAQASEGSGASSSSWTRISVMGS